jgi:hypothetical protein
MPDSVTFSARPSLIALGFGLGEQLFRSGLSTHHKTGDAEVRGGCQAGSTAGGSEDSNDRGGCEDEVCLRRRVQRPRGKGALYRERLWPWAGLLANGA